MHRKRKPSSQLPLDGQKRRANESDCLKSINSNNRAGTVSNILLRNFMCHSLLEVEFKNNINFIVGHNGSGKSAILTSLIVGLGGRATITNRGKSIKGFIKAGKNSASVEITLTNEGPMAYKPNVYGNKIIVSRNFSTSGSGNYRIKSSNGETISTQAKEVQRICLSLNIQVDNPVCILTQDTSRNFLNTSDPHQKFKLFMRATRLETLLKEYEQVNDNKNDAVKLMRTHEETFRKLKEDIDELERKLENHRSIAKLHQKVSSMQLELLWAKVRDLEEDMQIKLNEVQKLEEDLQKIQTEIDASNKKRQSFQEEINSLQTNINKVKGNIDEQKKIVKDFMEKINNLQRTLTECSREKNILERDISNKELDSQSLQKEINKITENLEQIEEEKRKRLEELSNMEEKMKGIRDLLDTSQNEKFQLQNSITYRQEEEYNLNAELVQIDKQIETLQTRMNSMKNESSNLVLYGRDMPRIIDIIQRNKNRFRQMPRGPLGSYIKLNDKKWAVAVEGFIGSGILKAFTVDNQDDNNLLMNILNEHWKSGSKPTVITSKFFFQIHDVSKNIVQGRNGCVNIYETLEISDPVVANCLIDQLGIESILLIPSTEKAIELMSNAENVPKNCRQGVTVTGDKYYPDPNYKMYSSRYRNAQFLQISTGDVIKQIEADVGKLNERKNSTKKQQQQVNKELWEQREKIKSVDVKVSKLNRALTALKNKYDNLRSTEEPDITNVHELENELKELKKSIDQRKIAMERIESKITDTQKECQETRENLSKAKEILKNFEEQLLPLEEKLNNLRSNENESNVHFNFTHKRFKECQNNYKLVKSEYLSKKEKVDKEACQAANIGERPESLRQVNDIMNEINETSRTLRKIESSVEKPEEIMQQIEEKSEKFNQNSQLLGELRKDVKELQVASEKRKKFYKRLEDYFVTIFSTSFQSVLKLRQFKGEVEIDLKNQKLDLIVIPQQGSQGHTSTSNLSGGERSFSTVAFLYSLWQCMEFPFYILDEFDVFMDKVNRTKVMEILLYHAKSASDKQFLFLTPQDISFVNEEKVAIHRLENPERAPIA